MRIATLKNETDISALADRLFGDLPPKVRRVAEAALLAANPNLRRSDGFKPGALVEVPEVPGVKLKPSVVADDPRTGYIVSLKAAVSQYGAHLAASLRSEARDIKDQLELLHQREVVDSLNNVPGADELAGKLADSLSQAAHAIPDAMKSQDDVFARIEFDLDSLL